MVNGRIMPQACMRTIVSRYVRDLATSVRCSKLAERACSSTDGARLPTVTPCFLASIVLVRTISEVVSIELIIPLATIASTANTSSSFVVFFPSLGGGWNTGTVLANFLARW